MTFYRMKVLGIDGGFIGKTVMERFFKTEEECQQCVKDAIQGYNETNPKYHFNTEPETVNKVTGYCNWQFGIMITSDTIEIED